MKFKRIALIVPVMIGSITLSGCSMLSNLFSSIFNRDNIKVTTLNKTKLQYTYKDYMTHNIYTLDNCPLQGSPKLLVVPVWFTDSGDYIPSSKKAKVREDIQKAYFGSDSDTGWKSVSGYYSQLSEGKLKLDGVVTDWYNCGMSSTEFYSETAGADNTCDLVTKAVSWYQSTYGVSSMSSFDSDHNGYLDGVMLIYGSPDAEAMSSAGGNMWAYCFWLQQPNGDINNPIPNVFFWASYDFMYSAGDGYEWEGPSYGSGDTNHCNIDTHTYIHEMGHVLGLEDYYDYSYQCNPAGGFSMQDCNVGSHDPYSAMAYGWVDPIIPTETCKLELKPFQDSGHDLVLLSNHTVVNSPFDEYLLVEFYSPTGLNAFDVANKYKTYYPQGPDKYGIRLWHVDARLTYEISEDIYSKQLVTEPKAGRAYTHAFSNTYYSKNNPSSNDYASLLGEEYSDYDILHLIRYAKNAKHKTGNNFSSIDLFSKGYSFSMDSHKSQFVNTGKLDSGETLGWSFKVNSISKDKAVVTFYWG